LRPEGLKVGGGVLGVGADPLAAHQQGGLDECCKLPQHGPGWTGALASERFSCIFRFWGNLFCYVVKGKNSCRSLSVGM